ncbi:MAG: transglutaminase-like domain-containing protein [Myxococcota bacterium]
MSSAQHGLRTTRRQFLAGAAGAVGCAHVEERPSEPLSVSELARGLAPPTLSERERAVVLYEYVRDVIRFGFQETFDDATPEETLRVRLGHCNPQGELLCELARSVGIRAEQHFVTINGDLLNGILRAPSRITHSYVRFWIGGRPIEVDGYVCDPTFFRGAQARLKRGNAAVGFAVHRDGSVAWDGWTRCMSQMADPSMVLEAHGPADPRAFYGSDANANRLNAFERFLLRSFALPAANSTIDRIRREGGELG